MRLRVNLLADPLLSTGIILKVLAGWRGEAAGCTSLSSLSRPELAYLVNKKRWGHLYFTCYSPGVCFCALPPIRRTTFYWNNRKISLCKLYNNALTLLFCEKKTFTLKLIIHICKCLVNWTFFFQKILSSEVLQSRKMMRHGWKVNMLN